MKVVADRDMLAEDGLSEDEINEVIAAMQEMVDNGTLFDNSTPVDMEQLAITDPELYATLIERIDTIPDDISDDVFDDLPVPPGYIQ